VIGSANSGERHSNAGLTAIPDAHPRGVTTMAEIGDELIRDVAHRMRDTCEPRQRAGVILTDRP